MTSESDYEPSEEEEEQRASEGGIIDESDNESDEFNEDDDVEFGSGEEGNEDGEDDEDDVSNFLNDVGDPLAAIEGLGLSDDAFAKFVRSQKKKHQDRRLSRRLRIQSGGSQPGDQKEDLEEDEGEEDAALWMDHGPGGDGDEDFQEDPWSDALAESFGLTPAMSRKQEKRRQQAKIKKLKRGKMAKDRSGLPEVAKAKLGDGNLKYVAGDYEAAAELFMDCIRLAPQFPDAYSSLSRLYDEIGDHKKSLNFLMFAAHLTKKDSQIWKDAVIKSKEQGMLRQAIYCINQVIRRERDDADWRYERGMLLAELEENRKALVDLEYYWNLNPENPEVIKQITRLYFRLDKLEDAKQAIQNYISEFPENIDLTHVNLLAELFVNPALSNWEEVLALLEQTKENHLDESEEMPIELESKGAIAMVHLGEVEKGTERLQQVLEQPVEVFADVYAWVASELEAMGHSHAVLPFLKALSHDPSTSSMEFWKRYAGVAEEIYGLDGCIDAWQGVLERLTNIHPEFVDAVIELTDAYCRNKDMASASSTLDLLNGAAPFASGTVYIPESTYLKRAKVIKLCNKSDTFVKLFYEPVLKTLNCILNSPEYASKNRRRKKGKGKEIDGSDFFVWQTSQERRRRNMSKDKGETEFNELNDENKDAMLELESLFEDVPVLENLLKGDQNFGVVLHLAKALISERKIDDAIEISQLSVTILGKKHPNRERRDAMRIHLADAYSLKGDLSNALKHIKVPAERWPESRHIWNIFTRIVIAVGGVRQTAKFIGNLRKEHPSSVPLALLQGHVYLQNYSYANALAEYMDAFRLDPQEPLVMLCISNLFANYACSRNANDRVRAVIQSFAWLQESGRNCNNPVETAYNAGRLAQQFSLMHLAVPLYREALHYSDELQMPDIGRMEVDETETLNSTLLSLGKRASFAQGADRGTREQELSGTNNMSREAAFNLSLILRESGADAAAKSIMRKYLTF